MRTLAVGTTIKPRRNSRAGVTLIELLIVTAIIALVAGLAFPTAAAGLEQMRMRSAADSVVNFLNTAIDRAERRQQVIELVVSQNENLLLARSPDAGFSRRLDLPNAFRISAVRPADPANTGAPRSFVLYPGGTVPRIAIEIASTGPSPRRRLVMVDPFTGVPKSVEIKTGETR